MRGRSLVEGLGVPELVFLEKLLEGSYRRFSIPILMYVGGYGLQNVLRTRMREVEKGEKGEKGGLLTRPG